MDKTGSENGQCSVDTAAVGPAVPIEPGASAHTALAGAAEAPAGPAVASEAELASVAAVPDKPTAASAASVPGKRDPGVVEVVKRPLTLGDLRELGLARGDRVLSRTVQRSPVRGIWYVDGQTDRITVPEWVGRNPDWWRIRHRAAAVQRLRPDAHVGGLHGAFLRGIEVGELPPDVHFIVPRGSREIRRPGMRSTRSQRHGADALFGIAVQKVSYLIGESAKLIRGDDLVIFLDSVLGGGRGSVGISREELLGYFRKQRDLAGIVGLREALALCRAGTDSPWESRVRLALVGAGLPEPVIHHPIEVSGGIVLHPDLAYVDQKIAIEVQGMQHYHRLEQALDDKWRFYEMAKLGWRIVELSRESTPAGWVLLVRKELGAVGK